MDFVSSKPKKVLLVVSNPVTPTTVGWPVGFWAAELPTVAEALGTLEPVTVKKFPNP